MTQPRATVLICAHSQDEAWTQRLVTQLAVYRDQLDLWDEHRLATTPDARAALADALGRASAAVLLLSPAWLASRFAAGGELEQALAAPEAADGLVLPVRVEACDPTGVGWLAPASLRPPEPPHASATARRVVVEATLREVARECGTRLRAAAWSRPAPSFGTRSEANESPALAFEPYRPTRPATDAAALHAQRRTLVALLRARAARPAALAASRATLLSVLETRAHQAPRPSQTLRKRARRGRRETTAEPLASSAPTPARPRPGRRLLRLLLVLGAAYFAFQWYVRQSARLSGEGVVPLVMVPASAPPPIPEGVMERPYDFQTVRLDAQGHVQQRTARHAPAFSESLADGVILELVPLHGGTFSMGSTVSESDRFDDEAPQHRVTVAPFVIGKLEVTQAQWQAVAALARIERDIAPRPAAFPGDNRPVESITWHDAVEFCARLARHTGRPYRLPTEAEWEYAARAGSQSPWAYGEALTANVAHHASGAHDLPWRLLWPSPDTTSDVGTERYANAFGLYDVHGNVWEWTADVWHDSYEGAPTDGRAWTQGGNQERRVRRGGAWDSRASSCRSALRNHSTAEYHSDSIGLRVACGLATPRAAAADEASAEVK